MKLAFLGPAPPLRGGIVTHLAMLARELTAQGHEVYWSSFRRQYPRWLFPGGEQTGKTAPWLAHPHQPRFVPWSLWSWWRTYQDIRRASPQAVILSYWIPFFAPGYYVVARLLRRFTSVRVVYILHNVIPHERYPLSRWWTRRALRQGHAFVAQSQQVQRDLAEVVPEIAADSVRLTPHPVYDFSAPGRPRKTRQQARQSLGLSPNARLVLYFGFIKPYKGVMHLIDAAPLLKERFGAELQILLVGDIYGDSAPYLSRLAEHGVSDVCQLVAEFVPDEIVEDYFLAADLVALPYVSATQSGIVQIAYNYDRPVVTTNVGGLAEVVKHDRTGLVVPPADSAALAAAITRFFTEDMAAELSAGIAAEKKHYSWDKMARTILELAAHSPE